MEFELKGEVYVVQESEKVSTKFTTPKEALDAYFSCQEWVDRIPLVVNSERVGKLMAKYYTAGGFSPPKFVEIEAKPKLKSENPNIYLCKVILDASETQYFVQETKAGYRVNWEESQIHWKLTEARKRNVEHAEKVRKHKVEGAEFVVRLTTKRGEYPDWTKLRLDVWNNSKAFIGLWNVIISFYDKDEEYLGQETVQGQKLEAWKEDVRGNVRYRHQYCEHC